MSLCFLFIAALPAVAQTDISGADKGTSPDDWFKSVKKQNADWKPTDDLSGGMRQILQAAVQAVSRKTVNETT